MIFSPPLRLHPQSRPPRPRPSRPAPACLPPPSPCLRRCSRAPAARAQPGGTNPPRAHPRCFYNPPSGSLARAAWTRH